jgi:hypothetical protein
VLQKSYAVRNFASQVNLGLDHSASAYRVNSSVVLEERNFGSHNVYLLRGCHSRRCRCMRVQSCMIELIELKGGFLG